MSQFPPPVPKPPSPGAGQTALAKITGAYVNVRTGPGTTYQDIGDIRNNTVLVYYPATRTGSGWVWIEQFSVAGWVSTGVISFEHVTTPQPPAPGQATPYDGKIAVWHWKGDVLPQNSIEDVARSIKQAAPYVTQVWVKISDATPRDGAQWMGYWDTKRSLAIDGPQSIDRWVQVLQSFGMEFHAWSVPKGSHTEGETNILIDACKRPGVKSLILDVEPYAGFWQGGQAGVRPFMTRLRRALPGSFHIGLGVDPRRNHYASIFPQEWYPFVNSVHPMDYWATFQRDPEDVLRETYEIWGGYGRPIIPILDADAPPDEMNTAINLAVQRYKAPGLSWWRLGAITPAGWRVINQPIKPGQPPPPVDPSPGVGDEIVVTPDDPGFAKGTYTGKDEFSSFQGTWGWNVFYKTTEPTTSKVWARWSPAIRQSGKYEISVFVAARHGTTRNARFKITSVKGAAGEIIVSVDQSRYNNQWVPLGVFDLEKATANAGTIFLNDLTGETGLEIAFDAIRWRQVVDSGQPYTSDGYDVPVGTTTDRRSTKVWPGAWYDASPFAKLYFVGTPQEAYHTGADLNLPRDADAHSVVYAAASGIVTFAGRLPTWGNVIIIQHDPLATTGMALYGRYAHVEEVAVKVGERVRRGQPISKVGNAFGRYAYHLHFDLSYTNILERNPAHWPGKNLQVLLANYLDPKEFVTNNRPRT